MQLGHTETKCTSPPASPGPNGVEWTQTRKPGTSTTLAVSFVTGPGLGAFQTMWDWHVAHVWAERPLGEASPILRAEHSRLRRCGGVNRDDDVSGRA